MLNCLLWNERKETDTGCYHCYYSVIVADSACRRVSGEATASRRLEVGIPASDFVRWCASVVSRVVVEVRRVCRAAHLQHGFTTSQAVSRLTVFFRFVWLPTLNYWNEIVKKRLQYKSVTNSNVLNMKLTLHRVSIIKNPTYVFLELRVQRNGTAGLT